jgi:hypothetical protein
MLRALRMEFIIIIGFVYDTGQKRLRKQTLKLTHTRKIEVHHPRDNTKGI